MKQVIIIHGSPDETEFYNPSTASPSNFAWIPWIQKQLSLRDQISNAPDMPKPYDPTYQSWKQTFQQFAISSETTLIGHSCGGGFLLRYLSEHPEITPKQVILVAPWLDPEPHELTTNFFDFTIDNNLDTRTRLDILMSDDDFEGCLKSFEIIKQALPNANYHQFTNKGHFCDETFPELLELIVKDNQ